MSNDRDWRPGDPAQRREDKDAQRVPGKHANTDFEGSGVQGPTPNVPGKRSATESLEAHAWRAVGVDRPPESAEDAATLAVDRRDGGEAVDASIAASVGAHTGVDVSGARVHKDPLSRQATRAMNARAFAFGSDVFLGPGESERDTELMAHELTHVAQVQVGGAAQPHRKLAMGAANTPAEKHADSVAASVAGGSPATNLIIDSGPLAPGQMLKTTFLAGLKPHVVAAANDELGMLGSALGCPYIVDFFTKYGALPASSSLSLIHRWIPASKNARSAAELYPLIVQRVRAGVHTWKETGKLPADLAAAEPALAAQATSAAPPQAQNKSLDGMEQELGPGEPVANRLAAPLGAEGARLHRGPVAERMAAEHNAVAFAVGPNVVMGKHAPEPGTGLGDALLAHELAHVAQQKDVATDPAARKKPIGEESQTAERDADRAAGDALSKERLATLGNFAGQVGDVMKTGVQLQRCDGGNRSVDRITYVKKHDTEIRIGAANHLRELPFPTGDAAAKWVSGGEVKFKQKLAEQMLLPDTDLESLVRPEELGLLVGKSRLLDEAGSAYGPDKYFDSVGIEIGNSLFRRSVESLRREVPRYAQARLASAGQPNAEEIAVSHPIDPLVLTAIIATVALDIDRQLFQKNHPELAGAPKVLKSRKVTLKDEGSDWHRLQEPMDATPEEIATALYGKPTEAFDLQIAHPLYGKGENAIRALAKGGALADEVALAQAAKFAPASNRPAPKVIEQIRMNSTLLKTSVKDAANRFGLARGTSLDPIADKLSARADSLMQAGEAEVAKWDGHAAAQAALIAQASLGLDSLYQRLKTYAGKFDVKLDGDPGAFGLPDEHRKVLRENGQLWYAALLEIDFPSAAEQRLQEAGKHAATIDIDILERQLSAPQQAAHNAAADPDAKQVTADMDPASLGAREVELRKKLAMARAQIVADPKHVDPSAVQTGNDTRELVFEAQVVLQAESVDQAWRFLDDADGFWAHLTLDAADLKVLKMEGKFYYSEWKSVYELIKKGTQADKEAAHKKYVEICGNPKFQDFLKRVNTAVQDAQRRAMIAKLIAMVIITIASMGAGAFVEGLVGGAEAVGAATAGASAARTAGAVAGFVTEAGSFTLMSNLAFSKDHGAGALLTEFGKNIIMFGALRGVSSAFKAAGLAKVVEAAKVPGAGAGATAKSIAVQTAEQVAMGGAAVLAGLIEAKIKEQLGGRALSDAEVQSMVGQAIAQQIIMVVVGRLMKSPLQTLKLEGAMITSKTKAAKAAAAKLEALAGTYQGKEVSKEQLRELIAKDREQLDLERAAFEEIQAKLKSEGKDTKAVDEHLKQLEHFKEAAKVADMTLSLDQQAANHYNVPREKVGELISAHEAQGSTAEVMTKDPKTGLKTYKVTPKSGSDESTIYFTEQLPEWTLTPNGAKVWGAAVKAGVGEAVLDLPAAGRDALHDAENALAHNDVDGAKAAMDKSGLTGEAKGKVHDALAAGYTIAAGRKPIKLENGAYYDGPTHDTSSLKVSQDWVSPATSALPGKESIPIPELANRMEAGGWRGDPLETVQMSDGEILSIDNRRVVAARQANSQAQAKGNGTPLPEVPIKVYKATDPFPPSHWEPEKVDSFELKNPIRKSAKDGSLYTGAGPKSDPIVYGKGSTPKNMEEAGLFRSANQGKSLDPSRYPNTAGRFPVGGSTHTPIIKQPKPGTAE